MAMTHTERFPEPELDLRENRDATNIQATENGRQMMHSLLFCVLYILYYVAIVLLYVIVPGLLTRSLYRAKFHALASVPGPRFAAVTSLWYIYHVRNGHMFTLAKTLHKRYGPVVRVRPNEVWFDSGEAFRIIYNPVGGFDKSDFYLSTSLTKPRVDWKFEPHFPDTLDLLSERDRKRYRLQRRLIGPVYNIANLKRHEAAIDGVISRAISQLRTLGGATVDLKEWMHIIAVECLGAAVFSWSPGLLKNKSDGGSGGHSYLGWRKKSVFGLVPGMVLLDSMSKYLGRAFSYFWRLTYPPPPGFKPFFTGVQRQTKRRLAQMTKGQKLGHKDILADLVEVHREKPDFTFDYLKRMTVTNFGAGHETMASTLTSAFASICSRPNVQDRVTAEIRQAPNPSKYDSGARLRYTNASIKESQRLHPVLGMSLPRAVPPQGLTLHGHHFPPDTTVGCCPASLHRNATIFGADPEEFKPERWMEGDTRAMERLNLIWGGGARTCPGRQLAELVVYKVVPAIFEAFDVEVKEVDEEGPVYFLSMMTGVKARFIERGADGSVT